MRQASMSNGHILIEGCSQVIQRTLEEQMGEIGKITTDRSYAIRWLENMGMSIRPRTSGVYQECKDR